MNRFARPVPLTRFETRLLDDYRASHRTPMKFLRTKCRPQMAIANYRGILDDDIEQYAWEWILKALHTYDPNLSQFPTWAHWRAYGALTRLIDSGRKPTARSIAEANMYDLDHPVGPSQEPVSAILAGRDEDPAEIAARNELAGGLHAALGRLLNPRAQAILARRFGLDGDAPESLKAVARRHSLSRERIRQIEEAALDKLRSTLQPAA